MARQEILDRVQKYVHPFRVTEGKGFRLQDFDPGDTLGVKLDKGEASELLAKVIGSAGNQPAVVIARATSASLPTTA